MAKADFAITFEIEPVVKLICLNKDCRFNLAEGYCILKKIIIGGLDGKCQQLESRKEKGYVVA